MVIIQFPIVTIVVLFWNLFAHKNYPNEISSSSMITQGLLDNLHATLQKYLILSVHE